ncbi:MAG: MBL fold metallo-hydrolase [Clostridia bacterium]|jgi:7,8-dihydropterin-6-yl-methyl-4-(beta-D-ribofuranosyl)aminobenzene 5'-phosphate synthase|nr:MBL fold metallo-hydrolase [Clostridia bacterium]
MKIKATVLCENCVFSNLGAIAEHGWSVYLETDRGNYLFDTGQGLALINNARIFKKDLSKIRGIILSHHHSDHTGGLMDALTESGPVDVYAHPGLFKEGFLVRSGEKYIGVPYARIALESKGARFRYNKEFIEIAPGLHITGEVPRLTDFETGDKDLVLKTEEGLVRDPLLDDQSIVVETEKGLVIILGCSHAGVINIIDYAVKKTGQERIHAVIGGTHLWTVSAEQQEKTIQAFKDYKIERLGVSHCTGLKVAGRLAQELEEKFFFCNVGTVIEA